MSTYSYSAKSLSGQTKTGSQEAASEAELAHILRDEGFVLTSFRLVGPATQSKRTIASLLPSLSHIPLIEKVVFAQHLAVMVGAGLSLTRSLEALGQQTKNKKLAAAIKGLNEDIKKGTSLADALTKYPKIFSELFINMVRVGETSGNLEEVLRLLSDQMKKDHDLRSRVKGAMIYPSVILIAMVGIGAIMMVTIVPQLSSIFKELDIQLPLSTRIIIGISDFLTHYWPFVILGIIVLIPVLRIIFKSKTGKSAFDLTLIRLPIFGNIIKQVNSARLARTLSSMVKSGIPIVQALQIAGGTLDNFLFRKSLLFAAQEVQKGQPLSQAMKSYAQIYPPIVNQMIEVGEETGSLEDILVKLADFYEEEVDNMTKGLTSVIEPVLMIIIGAAVGFFAVSMIQPMYSMMNSL